MRNQIKEIFQYPSKDTYVAGKKWQPSNSKRVHSMKRPAQRVKMKPNTIAGIQKRLAAISKMQLQLDVYEVVGRGIIRRHVRKLHELAAGADPFVKKRLLQLAGSYEHQLGENRREDSPHPRTCAAPRPRCRPRASRGAARHDRSAALSEARLANPPHRFDFGCVPTNLHRRDQEQE